MLSRYTSFVLLVGLVFTMQPEGRSQRPNSSTSEKTTATLLTSDFPYLIRHFVFATPNPPPAIAWYDAETGQVSQKPAVFDLVAASFDDNGIALNPLLGSQTRSPSQLADPSLCGKNPWEYPCTTQGTSINKSWKCAASGELGGHANWVLATYEGPIWFENHSSYLQDDDYSFTMLRNDLAGVTQVDANRQEYLHPEFNSDQTINRFHTWYWETLHQAVDSDAGKGGIPNGIPLPAYTQTNRLVHGNDAIIIGQYGLDCAHYCGAEIHPVYAMAIHVSDSVDDDVWAIFVRNWGDEGYCSSDENVVDNTSFTFRFKRAGAVAVSLIPGDQSDPKGERTTSIATDFDAPGVGWSSPALVAPAAAGAGAVMTFSLPPASQGDTINGMLHLKWTLAPEKAKQPPGMIDKAKVAGPEQAHPQNEADKIVIPAGPERSSQEPSMLAKAIAGPSKPRPPRKLTESQRDEAESRLGDLLGGMTPEQKSLFASKVGSYNEKHTESVRLMSPSGASKPGEGGSHKYKLTIQKDPERERRDAQLFEALHAVYGDKIIQKPPQ